MKVCLIYSGWIRTYDQCKQNHKDMLRANEFTEVHVNETNTEIDYYKDHISEFESNQAPETKTRHTLGQWRNSYLAFLQAPKDCDIYVRIRYDIKLIGGIIDFETLEVHGNKVYIPSGSDYRNGVNDQFAYGKYSEMEKYFNVYLNYKSLFEQGYQFHTESYLRQNMLNQGIEIVRILNNTEIIR